MGLVALAWVAWQVWGTSWVAHRDQADTVSRLEQAWDDGRDGVPADGHDATMLVRIPRFGADVVVPVVEGVDDAALAQGLGHYPGSAFPGGEGNLALAGHRVTHGEPFRDLPDLRPGDRVLVETASATYVYVLDTAGTDLEVTDADTWVVADRPVNPVATGVQPPPASAGQLLTLTTCAELFHTDDRLVVFGHLEKVRPRTTGDDGP